MTKKLTLIALVAALLSACNMKTYTRSEAPMLFEALDTQPNGYKGSIGPDALFEITGTKASQSLLCRSVKMLHLRVNPVDSTAKSKAGSGGNQWLTTRPQIGS